MQPDEVALQKVRDQLEAVEMSYLKAMRARGFDPAQAENLALPSPLAELYAERQDLLERLTILQGRNFIDERDEIMSDLASKDCVPCRGGIPPMKGEELVSFQSQLTGWDVVNEHHLRKEYKFKDFKETQDFVNRVGDLAEEQWHHPDICFGWGRAEVTIWTHKIDGLTESDFILAAKIDALLSNNGATA